MPEILATVYRRCAGCAVDLQPPRQRPYQPGEPTWSAGPNCIHEKARRPALEFPITILALGDCGNCARTRREVVTRWVCCAVCASELPPMTLAEIEDQGGLILCPRCRST